MCFGSAITLFAADAEVTCPGSGKVHTKDNCKYTVEGDYVDPKCGTNGYQLYHCEVCGAHFIDDVKEKLGGCKEFDLIAEVPATCGEDGVLAHEECKVCKNVRLNSYVQGEGYKKGNEVSVEKKDGFTSIASDEIIVEGADGKLAVKTVDEALKIAKTADGHKWSEWTATATGKTRKCTVEGCTAVETHTHKFEISSLEGTTDATMNKPAKAEAVCEECGEKKTVDVYPKHVCKDYVTEIKAADATCTKEGVKETYYLCKCGKAYKDKAATKLMSEEDVEENTTAKHSETTEVAVTKATCTTYGMIGQVCSKCGAQVGETEVIAPAGHKYLTYPEDVKDSAGNVIHKAGDVIVSYQMVDDKETVDYNKQSCLDTYKIIETRYCVNVAADENDKYAEYRTYETSVQLKANDNKIELAIVDENGEKVTVKLASTVKAGAVTTEVAAKGHAYAKATTPADCQHGAFTFWYCTNDNCSLAKKAYVTITWANNGASAENKTYRTTDANYNPLPVIEKDEKHPMDVGTRDYVNEKGKKETIKVDGKDVYKQVENTAKDVHAIYTEQTKVEATCIKNGSYTGKCSCGADVSVVLDKIAHNYELKDGNKPTCSKTGKYTCKTENCGAYITIPELTVAPVTGVLTEEESGAKVAAEGHDLGSSAKVTTKQTCTTDEITTVQCKNCKATWSYVSGKATGHTMGEGFDTDGCKKADTTYVLKKSSDGKKVEAYAIKHEYVDCYRYIENRDAVKDSNGKETKAAEKAKAIVSDEIVEKLNLGEKTAEELKALNIVKATGSGANGGKLVYGKTAAYFCTECDEFVASESVNGGHYIDTTKEGGTAVAAVHELGEELKNGLKEGWYKCSVCGANILKGGASAVIEAKHTLTEVKAVEPTCTTEGNDAYYKCSCGQLFSDKDGKTKLDKVPVKAALGHDAITTTLGVYNEKDCTVAKYTYHHCSRVIGKDKDGKDILCNEEWIGEYVPATAHNSKTEIKAVAATCTTAGNTAGTECSVCCLNQVGGEVIPATGHHDANGTFYACNAKGRICDVATCPSYYVKTENNKKIYTDVKDRKAFEKNEDHKSTGSNIETIVATCETSGGKIYTCDVCHTIWKVENPTAPIGHKMVKLKTLVEATEVNGGKDLYVCANECCQEKDKDGNVTKYLTTEEVETPKLSDLKLNISVDNAVVEGAEIVESGKVKVTISISSRSAELYGTSFTVDYNANMFHFDKVVGVSEKFLVSGNAIEDEVEVFDKDGDETGETTMVTTGVKVLAMAPRNEAGDAVNVKIEESETLVEIYFTVVGDAEYDDEGKAKAYGFEIVSEYAGDKDGSKIVVGKSSAAEAGVKYIADVDGDGSINVNDLSLLIKLYRNDDYSAAADLDKDGLITNDDYDLLVDYLSGYATMETIRNATAE